MSQHRHAAPEQGWLHFRIASDKMVVTGRKWLDSHGRTHDTRHHGLFADGELIWGRSRFHARSGPWGNGALPDGVYIVDPIHNQHGKQIHNKGMELDTKDKAGNRSHVAFKIPIAAEDKSVHRTALFIHPDGNVKGTQGCIGIVGADALHFWNLWEKCPRKQRPTRLLVSGGARAKHPIERWGSVKPGTE